MWLIGQMSLFSTSMVVCNMILRLYVEKALLRSHADISLVSQQRDLV